MADDLIENNEFTELLFEDVPVDGEYSLSVSGPDIETYLLFDSIPFNQIGAGAETTDSVQNDEVNEGEQSA
jgi:hypothetical protein